jgi:hypothetical protein
LALSRAERQAVDRLGIQLRSQSQFSDNLPNRSLALLLVPEQEKFPDFQKFPLKCAARGNTAAAAIGRNPNFKNHAEPLTVFSKKLSHQMQNVPFSLS